MRLGEFPFCGNDSHQGAQLAPSAFFLFFRKTDPTSNLLGALKVSQLFTHEVFPDPPKLGLGRGAVEDHGWRHWLPHRRRRCRPPPTSPSRVLEPPAMSGMLRKIPGSRAAVLEVRIHLPPAGSPLRTRFCRWVQRPLYVQPINYPTVPWRRHAYGIVAAVRRRSIDRTRLVGARRIGW